MHSSVLQASVRAIPHRWVDTAATAMLMLHSLDLG